MRDLQLVFSLAICRLKLFLDTIMLCWCPGVLAAELDRVVETSGGQRGGDGWPRLQQVGAVSPRRPGGSCVPVQAYTPAQLQYPGHSYNFYYS